VRAAAATIAGLMSRVRPVGLPCRPMKLRLLEEADTSCPWSLSSFDPGAMRGPDPRQPRQEVAPRRRGRLHIRTPTPAEVLEYVELHGLSLEPDRLPMIEHNPWVER